MININDLISNDDIDAFRHFVFGNRFNTVASNGETHGYVEPLTAEQEKNLVSRALSAVDEWYDVLLRYSAVYPLCNQAVILLSEHPDDSKAMDLLAYNLQKYGFNESVGLAVCKLIVNNQVDDDFAVLFCQSGRRFYPEIAAKLSIMQKDWDQLYQKSAETYLNLRI